MQVRLKGQLCDACQYRSIRRPSRGYILKTTQDRHIVTMEHYIKVSSVDSVAASISSSRRPSLARYFVFK